MSPSERALTRRDFAYLIGAISTGCALALVTFLQGHLPHIVRGESIRSWVVSQAIQALHDTFACLVLALSVAFLAIRLSKPRLSLTQVARQPSVLACTTGIVMMVALVAECMTINGRVSLCTFLHISSLACSCTVAYIWFVFFLSGWLLRPSDWVDRFGLGLGVCWILAPAFLWISLIV